MGNGASIKQQGEVKGTANIRFATFQFSHHSVYVEEYQLYALDKNDLNNVPLPHVPHTRKNEIFDLDMYKHLDERALSVPHDLQKGSVNDLVKYLTCKCIDDLGRLRVLYTWMTSQDLTRFKAPLAMKNGSVSEALDLMKKKKSNYAQFFSVLCKHANLPCVVINGYLKGNNYVIGQAIEANKDELYGEWNAVLVDKNWRLVDCFWGACAEKAEPNAHETVYVVDETYFIPDPEELIYSHFPVEPKWQLLDDPLTLKQFQRRACLMERFFEFNMKVLSHKFCDIVTDSGEMELIFGVPENRMCDLEFLCLLFQQTGSEWQYVSHKLFQHDMVYRRNSSTIAVRIRFPRRGVYRVEIVGKDMTVTSANYSFDWVAIYKVRVNGVLEQQRAFPIPGEAGWGPGRYLRELGLEAENDKSAIVYSEGGYVQVELQNPENLEIDLSYAIVTTKSGLSDKPLESEGVRRERDCYVIEANAPPGQESALCVFAQVDDEEYGTVTKNVLNYFVISTAEEEVDDAVYDEIEDTRDELEDAIQKKSLALLEKAASLVEAREYQRYMPQELSQAKGLIQRIRNLQNKMHSVLALDQQALAEIRTANDPPPEVHRVMRSMLLLLGFDAVKTEEWSDIQAIMGMLGKESLMHRIREFDIGSLRLDIALGSKELLGDVDLRALPADNVGVMALYHWTSAIIEEMEARFHKDLRMTLPRTSHPRRG